MSSGGGRGGQSQANKHTTNMVQSSVWREAYFNSRDGNENFFLSISCSRREREFLSFNLMFETGTRISFSQSRASRREREFHLSISGFETRTRIEIETILARIFGNYIFCFFIDWYFQKKAGYFSKFLEIVCLFFSRNLNENLNFRDENGNIFYQSRVSRREREYFLSISCFETRTRNRKWFLKVEREKIKLILTGIPGNGNSRHSLLKTHPKVLL